MVLQWKLSPVLNDWRMTKGLLPMIETSIHVSCQQGHWFSPNFLYTTRINVVALHKRVSVCNSVSQKQMGYIICVGAFDQKLQNHPPKRLDLLCLHTNTPENQMTSIPECTESLEEETNPWTEYKRPQQLTIRSVFHLWVVCKMVLLTNSYDCIKLRVQGLFFGGGVVGFTKPVTAGEGCCNWKSTSWLYWQLRGIFSHQSSV